MVRVACHIHSEWSYDATWKLPDLAKAFSKRRYNVMLMSEHDRGFTQERWDAYKDACELASSEAIRLVPGIEYSDAANRVHVLVWDCAKFLGESLETSMLLNRVAEHGGVAVLAHPSRKRAYEQWSEDWAKNLLGIEVWNRKTDGWAPSREAQDLLKRSSLQTFVGHDFHTHRQWFPLSMRGEGSLTGSTAIEAMRQGVLRSFAFGYPVQSSFNGITGASLSAAEAARRALRPIFRNFSRRAIL